MADRTAGPSTNTESHVDFASLPPSALDSYIAYYGLAKTYPPPPSKRSPSPESGVNDDTMHDIDHKEAGLDNHLGSRRGSRQRNGGDDAQHQTTSSRLRPRSPTSSVAHLYGLGRRGGDDGTAGTLNGDAAAEAEEDPSPSHFFDVQEADDYLASVAGKHFASQPPPKEGEVVVQFLYRCRASDKCLKVAS